MTKAAYDSIRCQKSWSFILTDQLSSDGTREWGEGMENDHPSFQYRLNVPRVPLAQAWNQAVKTALKDPECEYIGIFNNDIVLHPKTIDHMIAFMDKTGYLLVSADNIKDRMSPETLQKLELPAEFTDYDCWPIEGWRAEGPDFSCFMINRRTIEVVGWFDENFKGAYCEDQDYHARINRAYRHAKLHNDLGIEPERIHAKRLSTAPYYHFASQTVAQNVDLRADVSSQHGRNQNYYLEKWGGEHPVVMDGGGNITPFGDARRNWKWWEGVEKYD